MEQIVKWILPALLLPCAAQAQVTQAQVTQAPTQLPDPTTIQVPDVTPSRDPQIRKDGYKFYYFHGSGVSFTQAYQDVKECRAHLVTGGLVQVPGFIPWNEAHRKVAAQPTPMYGLLGVVAASIVRPKMERGVRSNKMRRCMEIRGYERYAIPEKTWDMLNVGDEDRLVLIQAKLAAGPKPQDQAVTE